MAQRRIRRLVTGRKVKWVGVVLTLMLLVGFVGSIGRAAIYRYPRERFGSYWYFGLFESSVSIGWWTQAELDPDVIGFSTGWRYPGWFYSNQVRPAQIQWLPDMRFSKQPMSYVSVPLWMPLLLVATPTVYLWRTDRRAKPWQCSKCRYDLRGLEGGVCPECGEPTTEMPP